MSQHPPVSQSCTSSISPRTSLQSSIIHFPMSDPVRGIAKSEPIFPAIWRDEPELWNRPHQWYPPFLPMTLLPGPPVGNLLHTCRPPPSSSCGKALLWTHSGTGPHQVRPTMWARIGGRGGRGSGRDIPPGHMHRGLGENPALMPFSRETAIILDFWANCPKS